MIGAIFGDIVGSIYEFNPIKTKKFDLFNPKAFITDDSVLTIAVADWILHGGKLSNILQTYGRNYPKSYGSFFHKWIWSEDPHPYNSWGNGSAMRVSPIGFAFNSKKKVLEWAKKSAEVTHNHPEGIKGAQATAMCIHLARKKKEKAQIKQYIETTFQYNLNRTIEEIRPQYRFDVSCQGTVPVAILCYLESKSLEEAIRNAISLGGDADTLACICGGIAHAFYGISPEIRDYVYSKLDKELSLIVQEFSKKYLARNY